MLDSTTGEAILWKINTQKSCDIVPLEYALPDEDTIQGKGGRAAEFR